MTTALNDMANTSEPAGESVEGQASVGLVRQAQSQGLSLTGPEGLLKQLTRVVLETAPGEEMIENSAMTSVTGLAPGPGTSVAAPVGRRRC